MSKATDFPRLLEVFFTDRLIRQRRASPHTIAAYRDTFRLLFGFAQQQLGKQPSAIELKELDAPLIGAFLDHLEKCRGNGARTRNARLAAIHSFFRYAALQEPSNSALIQRVLAIPSKRCNRRLVGFLTRAEIDALIAAPDRSGWAGRRDYAMLLLAVQTGLRVSELVGLRRQDVVFGVGAHIRCTGKGRKERCTPLRKETVKVMRDWLREFPEDSDGPLFPSARGRTLSRDGVEYLLTKHVNAARGKCASLRKKRVSPHVLRHSTAMDLLAHGVDHSVIALWLGHESTDTTQIYLAADLTLKQKALAKSAPLNARAGTRFRPKDRLLAFLKGL
ncbi:MAG: site-specific integrase [Burkholderiales bacterium]